MIKITLEPFPSVWCKRCGCRLAINELCKECNDQRRQLRPYVFG